MTYFSHSKTMIPVMIIMQFAHKTFFYPFNIELNTWNGDVFKFVFINRITFGFNFGLSVVQFTIVIF